MRMGIKMIADNGRISIDRDDIISMLHRGYRCYKMAIPKKIQSPEKEIRFTRAAQGRFFAVVAAVLMAISLGLWVLATQGTEFEAPRLEGYLWTALLPLPLAIWLLRMAVRCIRHAYLIFTPLGIEIFPLFRPEKYMTLITWQEVFLVEVDLPTRRMVLHHNAEKTSGIVLSLRPILPAQQQLLAHAMQALMQKRSSAG